MLMITLCFGGIGDRAEGDGPLGADGTCCLNPQRGPQNTKNTDDAFIASSAQALPFWLSLVVAVDGDGKALRTGCRKSPWRGSPPNHVGAPNRSEEHTSELQSP